MGAFLTGTRFLVHLVYERPLRGFRAAPQRALGADRRRRRRRPAAAARAAASNPELGYRPVGFVDDDPRKKGMRVDRGLEVLGTTDELAEVLEDVEPDEVLIAIPSAPGHAARHGRAARAASAACRCARCRPSSSCCRPAAALTRQLREVRVEDVLGREPGADGDRVRRRLPDRPLRDGHRRGRLDRLRAVPPDRAREPEPARAASTTPRRTCSRSSASWSSERHVAQRRSRCWPTARTRSACARCSPSTGRRSSSTPPPTSTSR